MLGLDSSIGNNSEEGGDWLLEDDEGHRDQEDAEEDHWDGPEDSECEFDSQFNKLLALRGEDSDVGSPSRAGDSESKHGEDPVGFGKEGSEN